MNNLTKKRAASAALIFASIEEISNSDEWASMTSEELCEAVLKRNRKKVNPTEVRQAITFLSSFQLPLNVQEQRLSFEGIGN